jgi:hypothetical protein
MLKIKMVYTQCSAAEGLEANCTEGNYYSRFSTLGFNLAESPLSEPEDGAYLTYPLMQAEQSRPIATRVKRVPIWMSPIVASRGTAHPVAAKTSVAQFDRIVGERS